MPAIAFNVFRAWPAATFLIAELACSGFVSSTQAAVIGGASVTFPSYVTPGQSVNASVQISNQNTGAEIALVDTVTSITLIPSCALADAGGCAAGSTDPGVFLVSSFGVGEAGTSCGRMTFSISEVDATSGKLQFVPGVPVKLSGAGAVCNIDFTVSVRKLPTKDAGAATGTQTIQILDATVTSGGGTSLPRGTSVTTVQLSPQVCADIDGDGVQGALSDGLIFIRALFGLTGAAVVNGAINPSSTRTTWEDVRIHMNTYCGTNFPP